MKKTTAALAIASAFSLHAPMAFALDASPCPPGMTLTRGAAGQSKCIGTPNWGRAAANPFNPGSIIQALPQAIAPQNTPAGQPQSTSRPAASSDWAAGTASTASTDGFLQPTAPLQVQDYFGSSTCWTRAQIQADPSASNAAILSLMDAANSTGNDFLYCTGAGGAQAHLYSPTENRTCLPSASDSACHQRLPAAPVVSGPIARNATGKVVAWDCSKGQPRGGVMDGSAYYLNPFDFHDAAQAWAAQCNGGMNGFGSPMDPSLRASLSAISVAFPSTAPAPTATGLASTRPAPIVRNDQGKITAWDCAAGQPRGGVMDGSAYYLGPFDYVDAANAWAAQCNGGRNGFGTAIDPSTAASFRASAATFSAVPSTGALSATPARTLYAPTRNDQGKISTWNCSAGQPRAGVTDGSAYYLGPFDYVDAANAWAVQCNGGNNGFGIPIPR